MRAHKTKLERLNNSIRQPDKITLTLQYADGHEDIGLSLDAALPEDARLIKIFNGSLLLGDWLPVDCWLSI